MPKSRQRKVKIKKGFVPLADREIRDNAARVDAHRRENNLCLCEVETIPYENRAAQEADQTPNKICLKCERKILRLGIFPSEETRESHDSEWIAKGLFGQKRLLDARLR